MVASYYHFDIAIHTELPDRVAISRCEIVGGVARDCDLVPCHKIKNCEFLFLGMLVGDSQKFVLVKMFGYTVRIFPETKTNKPP